MWDKQAASMAEAIYLFQPGRVHSNPGALLVPVLSDLSHITLKSESHQFTFSGQSHGALL